ncbi:hypothetical protein M758_12G122900 [Ceratodon purpureus]|nr:hypothetical protein M758_12G122900 [Ceratodon purpureus]
MLEKWKGNEGHFGQELRFSKLNAQLLQRLVQALALAPELGQFERQSRPTLKRIVTVVSHCRVEAESTAQLESFLQLRVSLQLSFVSLVIWERAGAGVWQSKNNSVPRP